MVFFWYALTEPNKDLLTVSTKPACYKNITWRQVACSFMLLLYYHIMTGFECLVLKGQSLIDIQTYFQKLGFPLLTILNWVWLCNIQSGTYVTKWTCWTYIAAASNQTFTPVFIHDNTVQDHIMHIFLYLILTIVGVGVSEIKILKYGMTSVLDTVLISNTTICRVCQDWPVSTA
jgi:hypothetical protein